MAPDILNEGPEVGWAGRGGTLSGLGQSSHVALDSILLTVMLAITVRRRRTVDGVCVCVCVRCCVISHQRHRVSLLAKDVNLRNNGLNGT